MAEEMNFIKATDVPETKQLQTPKQLPVLKAKIDIPVWKNKTKDGKEYYTLQIPQGVLLTGRVNLFVNK